MDKVNKNHYNAIVIGTSAGGFKALKKVLNPLPKDFSVPIIIVRHQLANSDDYLIRALNNECQLQVSYAIECEQPLSGKVYIAPPAKHLLISKDGTFTLSTAAPVNFSKPSIDVLFKSAAKFYNNKLLAVILTGANQDGVEGAKAVKLQGGELMVQDPGSAEARAMPEATLKIIDADYIVWLDQIGPYLWTLTQPDEKVN